MGRRSSGLTQWERLKAKPASHAKANECKKNYAKRAHEAKRQKKHQERTETFLKEFTLAELKESVSNQHEYKMFLYLYGLEEYPIKTQVAIAKELGVTRQWVNIRVNQVLYEMRLRQGKIDFSTAIKNRPLEIAP